MSEHITGAAIPDDVMERAVLAGQDTWSDSTEYIIEEVIDAALLILTPAIERALLTRIANDAHVAGMEFLARNGLDTGAEEMFEREDWLRSFLSTEDEEKT